MTDYCVMFYARRYKVRPALFAQDNVCTHYLRACKIADYLNTRLARRRCLAV